MEWWNFLPRLRKVNVILGYFPGASFCFSDMWKSIIWLLQGGGTSETIPQWLGWNFPAWMWVGLMGYKFSYESWGHPRMGCSDRWLAVLKYYASPTRNDGVTNTFRIGFKFQQWFAKQHADQLLHVWSVVSSQLGWRLWLPSSCQIWQWNIFHSQMVGHIKCKFTGGFPLPCLITGACASNVLGLQAMD